MCKEYWRNNKIRQQIKMSLLFKNKEGKQFKMTLLLKVKKLLKYKEGQQIRIIDYIGN